MRVRLTFLAILLILSACDLVYRPEEPVHNTQVARPNATPLAPAPMLAMPADSSSAVVPVDSIPGRVVVAPGDALSKIARGHNIPSRAIIDENGLQPPYNLTVGQVLIIPSVRRYLIQPGDTIPVVSRRYDVDIDTLTRLNHLKPGDTLKVGLPLILPPLSDRKTAALQARSLPPPIVPPHSETPPLVIQPPSAVDKLKPEPLTAPSPVSQSPVQPIISPVISSLPPEPSEPPLPQASPPLPPPEKIAATIPEKTAVALVPNKPTAPQEEVSEPPLAPEQQSASIAAAVAHHRAPVAPLFTWPVRGKIISTFGNLGNGAHNDGLNISAPEGTEVDAADAGTVVYAGNALRGFGNLLLIKHAEGWVTAYGHNSALLVQLGDHVRRGQPIAKVGATGRVSGPQLHFEVRRGTDQGNKAFDPLDHLPANVDD